MSQTPSPDAAKLNQLRLLRALDEAAAKLEAAERTRHEPIAVIGVACRLPGGARDAAAFWQLLRAGTDATGEVPADRWDVDEFYDANPDASGKICTRRGSFLEDVDRFDAAHFGLSPREAVAMDPQQRLLLEVAHEALDSAGQLGDRLAQNATGVFVGITTNDYGHLLKAAADNRPLDAYFITGNAPNAAAGRISYLLGLRGQALAIDSACSSSLVTVHLACQSLRSGECALALAGGVNLILAPDVSAALSRARMLAPDGRCKTFDAAADGYGRGEGCGMIVLKRLSDAQRAGDTILAVIRSSAVNQDGPSGGFTVPSGAAQRALLQAALTGAKLAAPDIDYIEAHGTGTALGDPIEVGALGEVFGAGREAGHPLLLGSVKTNLGHLESAAGVTGLIKVVLSLWHREIPAHLHFRNPSPHIPWRELPVAVVTTHRAWPETGRPRRAGVSSFGVSGTNAHVIIEEAPAGGATRDWPLPRRRFFGERFWGPPRAAEKTGSDWLHAIAWRERPRRERAVTPVPFASPASAAERIRSGLPAIAALLAGPAYREALPPLERIAAGYARLAVEAVGLTAARDVAPAHRRLFGRLQELAAQAGAEIDPGAAIARLQAIVPDASAETILLARCGAQLPAVLRGQVDALSLLFPAGERISAASIYRDTPTAHAANTLVQNALAATLPAGRPLRVLEIGAGTGATTAAVLPALPAGGAEYVFTDVSPLFIAEARERYRDRPWVRAELLDIERDPTAQGFAPGEFDVVIAANVLHATRDVRASLRHVRSLLAGGGLLVLLEANAPLGFLDLVFGLTEGWWRFADHDLRPAHPLLPPARWREALAATGFTDTEAFTLPASAGEIFAQQSVLTARAAGAPPIQPGKAAGDWLVLAGDNAETIEPLLAALAQAGGTCHSVRPDQDVATLLASHPAWRGVIHAAGLEATDPLVDVPLRSALQLAHALIARPAPLFILTRGAVAAVPGDDGPGLGAAALWGFARTLAQEHPELRPICIDTDPATDAVAIAAELLRPDGETQIALRGDTRHVARLVHRPVVAGPGVRRVTDDGTYLVIGGLGGLGLPLARWLVEHGARHLVLAGRSAPTTETAAAIRTLAGKDADVRFVPMDVAVEADVARVLADIAGTRWPLRGFVHAAGVLDDGMVSQLGWDRFARVLGPKVAGAWHLHRLTRDLPLDWGVFFSSATALIGSPGQANHAAANAFLDALAHHRRARGLPALSINWGPWSDIGAAARRDLGTHLKTRGVGLIAPAKGWRVFGRLLDEMPTQVAVLPVNWAEVPASTTAAPFFSEVRTAPAVSASRPAAGAESWTTLPLAVRAQRLLEAVRSAVAGVLGLAGADKVDPTQGFFALGMDSLTSIELRNRLQVHVGRPLAATIAFDYPTAEKLAAALASHGETAATPAPTPAAAGTSGSGPLAIVGLALRFPGGADTPEKLWTLLRNGIDAITEVPRDRWDIDAYYDADPAKPGKMYSRHGGFIADVDQFDAGFFGISPREAEHMDPQHRLLLETAWEAFEHAAIAPDSLAGTPTGVFVGIGSQDYAQLLVARGLDSIEPYVGSGNAHSIAAGRLSYTLGLQGPALAVNTACSSSLVAIHLAAQSLRAGECDLALAGGVNLLLAPFISVNHSRARMLAADGRCKAFAAAADGFVRSDGCGLVVLKRLAAAQRDGDRILAVIRGTAVNQDGRTSGITVPSGPSQQAVIRAALREAGVAPAEISYVEAHGTGTSVGDPIELGALGAVFAPDRPPHAPLRVGSIKTNLGHLEAAAGVAGLIKVVLAFEHGEIPPHLHFKTPNPLVAWADLPVEIPSAAVPWPAGGPTRFAGVSSFGFGGTNAHLVVSEPPDEAVDVPPPSAGPSADKAHAVPVFAGPPTLALSARSAAALRALASRYVEFLRGTREAWADICHTAAIGRTAFPHRLALSAASAADAATELAKFIRGETSAGLVVGVAGDPQFPIDPAAAAAARAAIVARAARIGGTRRRVALPTYPFQRRRYWFEERAAPAAPAMIKSVPAYEIVWEQRPSASPDDVSGRSGAWCLIGEDVALAAELQRRGHTVVMDPAQADRGVVFLAQGGSEDLPRLLAVVRGLHGPARLWIVTRHAVAVSAGDAAKIEPKAGIPWGAAQVVGLERPELGAARIDVALDVGASALADELVAQSGAAQRRDRSRGGDQTGTPGWEPGEDDVALRVGGRFVARLRSRGLPEENFNARADVTYLITGGLGALGLRVARWLVEHGARHLLLLGRRAPSAEAEFALTQLRAQGATVTVSTADVTDRAALAAALAKCGQELPPLRGVFHLAGVAGFQALASLDGAACEAVMRPKVTGAQLLDELTSAMSLDAFVLFSSIAAVWGSKGQAHYAAANRFLDGLAQWRRAVGRPALSVAWGPWAGGGMATSEAQALLRASGVRAIAPDAALAALGGALASGAAHVVVAEVDWPVFREVYELRGPHPLFSLLPMKAAPTGAGALAPALSRLARHDRLARLRADVTRIVARVLKLPAGEWPELRQDFAGLGLDSLMALEVKNQLVAELGLALPAGLVFDQPTVERLAADLLARLDTVAAGHPAGTSAPERSAEIAALSEVEVEALLLKKLEAL